MSGNQFRLIAGLWMVTSLIGCAVLKDVGWREGYATAQAETASAKVRHDASMAKLGLCEWPKAFYAETHCGQETHP